MPKLAPPNYLQGNAAPGVIRPLDQMRGMTNWNAPQPNWRTREGPQNPNIRVAAPAPGITNPATFKPVVPAPQQMPPGLTPQQLQSWYATLYQGDELGQSLSSSLASQLGNTWTSGVVSPWQRAIMAYGGNLDPYYLKQLDQFTAPKWYNPFTKEELPVGMSLADALDPSKTGDLNVLAEAAKNPFSKLNQINRQLGLANAGANLNWAQHGAMNSGSVGRMLAESGIAAQEQRATAAQAVLDQISGTYSGFLNSLITAGQTQGQYVTDAMGRIRDLVTNQIIVPPTNQTQITPRDYDQPGVFPVGTPGFGPYRDKPLY